MQGSSSNSAEQYAAVSGAGAPFSGSGAVSRFIPKKLGEILLEEHLITPEKLDEALAIQKVKGGFLGQILVEMNQITQQVMSSCLVRQCKIPHLSLQDYEIGEEVLKLIPQDICLRYYLLPIDKMGRILTIAMVDPLDSEALEDVRRICPELRIKPILCDWLHFQVVASRVFHREPEVRSEEEELEAFGKKYGIDMSRKPAPQSPPPAPLSVAESVSQTKPVPLVVPPANMPPSPPTPETDAALDAAVFDLLSEMSSSVQEKDGSSLRPEVPAEMEPHAEYPEEPVMSSVEAEAEAEATHSPEPAMAAIVEEALSPEGEEESPQAPSEEPLSAMGVETPETLSEPEQKEEEPVTAHGTPPVSDVQSDPSLETLVDALNTDDSLPETASDNAAVESPLPEPIPHLDQVIRQSVESAITEALSTGPVPETVQRVISTDEALVVSRANLRDLEARDAERAKRMKHGTAQVSELNRRRTEAVIHTDDQVLQALTGEHLLPGLTFDTFVSGKNNAFSFKLCQAVAANPGGDFNPFFLYGDVGLGKTHLVNAIGHAIQSTQPDQRLCYISSSRFAARLQEATRDHAEEMFRANYCHWDALILDDIQFLGGRVEAQEEFFHLFNVLQQEERQIIIAGDKPPDRLGLLEQRLVSRFGSGVVAQVKPPEFEARLQILERAAEEAEVDIDEEALALIATRVADDVRKMMGALRKLLAFAKLMEQRVTAEMASESLGHLAP